MKRAWGPRKILRGRLAGSTTNATIISLRLAAAAGLEPAVAAELEDYGLSSEQTGRGFVRLRASLEQAATTALGLRAATRVVWELARDLPLIPRDLVGALAELDWERRLPPGESWAVRAGGRAPELRHSHYSALLVKDAVRDRFRRVGRACPPIDARRPRVVVDLRIEKGGASIGFDLGASSLHRRAARREIRAPLREDLAAGLALLAGARQSRVIVDPFCGSGTFLAEAVSIAAGRSARRDPARLALSRLEPFRGLPLADLREGPSRPPRETPKGMGFDRDAGALDTARRVITRYGLQDEVILARRPIERIEARSLPEAPGLVLTNPPWGRRLEGEEEPAWRALGSFARGLPGWTLAVLSGDPALTRHLGLRALRRFPVGVGGVDARLLLYQLRGKPA